MYNIHMLPGSYGDSLLIEYGKKKDPKYILIDGGAYYAFPDVIKSIRKIAPKMKTLELVVVTHIDTDHIEGIVKLLNQKPLTFGIEEIWFNGLEQLKKAEQSDLLGPLQGEYLSALIEEMKIPHNAHKAINGKAICIGDTMREIETKGGMKLTLLSHTLKALKKLEKAWVKALKDKKVRGKPVNFDEVNEVWDALNGDYRYKDEEDSDLLGHESIETWAESIAKEDKSVANISSIAFIAEYKDAKCLFSGDTPSANLLDTLEQYDLVDEYKNLKVDAWKMSHHGSKKSNQAYLMKKIEAVNILISSDGKRYHHPDPETIAKLIVNNKSNLDFHFNYHSEYTDIWQNLDWQKEYNYKAHFPKEGDKHTTVKL